jgi:5'-3' exonuclease
MTQPFTVLIDGNYQLHRCMHVPELQALSYNGVPTGGIYGTLRLMKNILSKFNVGRVIFVWDGGRSARRMQLMPTYKANRNPANEVEVEEKKIYYGEFHRQADALTEILKNAGVYVMAWPYKEADDLIGYIVRNVIDGDCAVASDDWDYLQLVSTHCSLYRPMKDQHIGMLNFQERLGYPRDWSIFVKACTGDGSDNIPGIPGVGHGTVLTLVLEYVAAHQSGASNIWDFAAQHKSARVRKIAAARSQVELNIKMIDISQEEFPEGTDKEILSALEEGNTFNERELLTRMGDFGLFSLISDFANWSDSFKKLV